MFLMTDETLTSLDKKVPYIMDYSSENKLVDFTNLQRTLYFKCVSALTGNCTPSTA